MGDDLSTGAKIGIGLVILCFLIAIVLALLMVVKNITNSGANQLESGLNQMMQTTYDDYDQKLVTGTKVASAIKLFQGENIGIIVNTKFDKKDNYYLYGMLLEGATAGTLPKDTINAYGEVYTLTKIDPRADGVSYGGTPKAPVAFNLNTRPITASGHPSYVRNSGKFMAYLIKDSTETIVGIYFVQQS